MARCRGHETPHPSRLERPRERTPSVSGRADGGQGAASALRRQPRRLEYLPPVFSRIAALGVRLRALRLAPARAPRAARGAGAVAAPAAAAPASAHSDRGTAPHGLACPVALVGASDRGGAAVSGAGLEQLSDAKVACAALG